MRAGSPFGFAFGSSVVRTGCGERVLGRGSGVAWWLLTLDGAEKMMDQDDDDW